MTTPRKRSRKVQAFVLGEFAAERPTLIDKARAARELLHRIRAILKVESLASARAFVRERGLVLLAADAELPNLVDATLGRRANVAERVPQDGASQPPWDWWRELSHGDEVACVKLFRNEDTAVARRLWPAVASCAGELAARARHGTLSPLARTLFDELDKHGPSTTAALCAAHKLKGDAGRLRFERARRELEAHLLVVTREEGGERVHELLVRWLPERALRLGRRLGPVKARKQLVQAAVDAAVIMKERAAAWFPWSESLTVGLIEELVAAGEIRRVEEGGERYLVSTGVVE